MRGCREIAFKNGEQNYRIADGFETLSVRNPEKKNYVSGKRYPDCLRRL